MKIKISKIVKNIRTYKDLCSFLHATCEYKRFNIVYIAGVMAKVNNMYGVFHTEDLESSEFKDYVNSFIIELEGLYPEGIKEFLYDYLHIKDEVIKELEIKWDWKEERR